MKRIYLLFLAVVLLSCEDKMFKDNEDNYIVIPGEQEVLDLLNGAYNRLIEVHNSDYFVALSRADDINIYEYYEYPDPNPPPKNACLQYGTDIPKNVSGDIYAKLYTAIANINKLLQHLATSGNNILLGELYFLRAYCYFKLARLFGTPPLVTDIDVNYFIEKPTYKEVYEFIEADMLKALELLPETYTGARVPGETPHKGTARAVLAEIYLAMAGYPVNDASKYSEAACLAGEVIETAEYYNYGLLNDMSDLWKKDNRHNKENIFGLFFTDSSSNENTINLKPSIKVRDDFYLGWQLDMKLYHTSMKFFMSFPNQYRREVSFTTGRFLQVYNDLDIAIPDSFIYVIYNPIEDPCDFMEYVLSKKFIELRQRVPPLSEWCPIPGNNVVTLYLFRYAHTLLTYAEAKTRAGEMDETCFEAVNMIRRRANKLDIYAPSEFDLQPGLTSEQFLDSLVWERAWELCHEPEGRWFDMVRLDLRKKLPGYFLPNSLDQYASLDSRYFNKDWYFYLIPEEDRFLNPNFEENDK